MYSIKEIFYTLQGEGANTGKPSVFCRFAGCNLWNGLEFTRNEAVCKFCDTDFVGTNGTFGNKYKTAKELVEIINNQWPKEHKFKYVVLTGGEPLLQVDNKLIDELHKQGFEIAVETNGTIKAPKNIDWICVSPKSNSKILQTKGNELKLIFPQKDCFPETFEKMEFDNFYLQAMDGINLIKNISKTIEYCKENPFWKLSIQTHKLIGIR
jgi:7-carboxy-7-deazaguanine synthase (Cx14CxxC type)